MENTKEMSVVSAEKLNELKALTGEQEPGGERKYLPRIEFVKWSREGEKIPQLKERFGMFMLKKFNEVENVWESIDLGHEIKLVVLLERKKLSLFDESKGSYISSPEFDDKEEVVPLFQDRKKFTEGTYAELKKMFEVEDSKTGSVRSELEDYRVLYCLLPDGTLALWDIHGTNMYAYVGYKRSLPHNLSVAVVETIVTNHLEEKNAQKWMLCDFEKGQTVDFQRSLDMVAKIRQDLEMIKASRSGQVLKPSEVIENNQQMLP
jgi:hypothetical protein